MHSCRRATYLIAELSGEIVPFVAGLRAKFNPDHVAWPVDITIAGSSGVGTFSEGEEIEKIIEILSPLISNYFFADVAFERIENFPNTGIYFLKPERELFDRMHEAVVRSGIRFNENRFPYNPHCTLKAGQPCEGDEIFQALQFPRTAMIECFSLYRPEPNGGTRIHRFEQGSGGNG